MPAPRESSSFRDFTRSFRRLVLVFHVIAGGAWMYLMPGGFPPGDLRFLANRVLPPVIVAMGIIGIYANRTGRMALLHAIAASCAAAWWVASVTGIVLFPISARLILPIGLGVAWMMSFSPLDRSDRKHRRSPLAISLLLVGAAIGILFPFTQRARPPGTHPLNGLMDEAPNESPATLPGAPLSKKLRVAPTDGTITFMRESLVMTVDPMLTFLSRSPDRCWTLFAPSQLREAHPRRLTHWSRSGSGLRMRYTDIGSSDLKVTAAGDDVAEIVATSQLPDAIYSHLNTFCEIGLIGHAKLALVFSPCSEKSIDVLPMDYPAGRPARFAYLDAGGVFHVVEATSGEKGPYHELASGRLERTQPMDITFLDAGRVVATVTLADWASQLSTDLSPTAGWGVPQNAIEFSLEGDSVRSGANIFISLASTSVGRGFDSVGHAPGIYRNRMTIRLIPP